MSEREKEKQFQSMLKTWVDKTKQDKNLPKKQKGSNLYLKRRAV